MSRKWKDKNFGTVKYFESMVWENLQHNTINGNYPNKNKNTVKLGIRNRIKRADFHKWCISMKSVIEGLYRAGEKPILKRIDQSKDFTLKNIMIATKSVPVKNNERKVKSKQNTIKTNSWVLFKVLRNFTLPLG